MSTTITAITPTQLFELLGFDVKDVSGLPSYERIYEYYCIHNRTLELGLVDDDTAGFIRSQIVKWNQEDAKNNVAPEHRKPIKLYIDSDGGALLPTMNLIDIIQVSKTPVWTIGLSRCYSAGGLVLMAGHKRFVYPHTTFLLHEGSTGAIGNTSKVFDDIEFQKMYEKSKLQNWILGRTAITQEDYERHYRREWYMMAEDIVRYGVADEITSEII